MQVRVPGEYKADRVPGETMRQLAKRPYWLPNLRSSVSRNFSSA
jgi:hypothetical protein